MNIIQGYHNSEIDKLKFGELKGYRQNKKYKYFFIYLLFLLNIISLFIFLFILKKEKDNLITKIFKMIQNDNSNLKNKMKENNNFLKLNKDLINENKNFIENKLKFIEKNQNLQIKKLEFLSRKQNKFDIINLFRPMEALGKKKIRIGRNSDGGYILLDDLKDIKIAYSFGISREISFDKDLADKNIDVFMYDHTIDKLPFENPKFHWKKIGLSTQYLHIKNMKSLNDLLLENGHLNQQNMILKIDIESNEWNIFQELSINILKQFKYIVGEFHFMNKEKKRYLNILKKIEITHQIIHLHCNNCKSTILDYYGYNICSLLEITFVQKEGNKFDKFNSTFPINGIDYKNCKKKKDFNFLLNSFI